MGAGAARVAMDWECTGNHYLAIPCIDRRDGSIDRINVLHRGQGGLLEWAATRRPEADSPRLIRPSFRVDGADAALAAPAWEQVERWIPRFKGSLAGDLTITGTLCAPGNPETSQPGALYLFELENGGRAAREAEVSLAIEWRWSLKTVWSVRPITGENRVWLAPGRSGVVLEQGGTGVSLAIYTGGEPTFAAALGEEPLETLAPDAEVTADNGRTIRVRITRKVSLAGGGRASVAFYFGVGQERDGALAAAMHFARLGSQAVLREGRLALTRLLRRLPDRGLAPLFNRCLLFNYFYALGRSIDDDRLVPLTSRSPLHPRPASFNERDALLWSLPALALADPPTAREALLQAYERHSHQPGQGAHYVDGGTLEPGFALDRCVAYLIALDRYVRATDDRTVLDEHIVHQVQHEIQDIVMARLHRQIFLCSTELAPSGDRPDYPYVTYDNALLAAACQALERVWVPHTPEDRAPLAGADDELAAALWRHATAEVDGLHVLAWATDLEGNSAVYDDPAGSLQLLPYYGFCDADDPIWRNTVDLLRSSRYPLWLDGEFPGTAERDDPDVCSVAALCSDLLGSRREDSLDLLRRLPLVAGLPAESYDPRTGAPAGALHHAPLAGFLAWALRDALEGEG